MMMSDTFTCVKAFNCNDEEEDRSTVQYTARYLTSSFKNQDTHNIHNNLESETTCK